MTNKGIIEALYETGLVHSNPAFDTVIQLLELADNCQKAWPYIVKNYRNKLLAVKDIKNAFGIGLKEAKDIMDMLWYKNQPVKIVVDDMTLDYHYDFQIYLDRVGKDYTLLFE